MRPAYSRHEFTYKNAPPAGGQPRTVQPGLLSDSDAKLGIFYKLTNFWPEITKFINIALKKKKKTDFRLIFFHFDNSKSYFEKLFTFRRF
jgi:hypothetical protein